MTEKGNGDFERVDASNLSWMKPGVPTRFFTLADASASPNPNVYVEMQGGEYIRGIEPGYRHGYYPEDAIAIPTSATSVFENIFKKTTPKEAPSQEEIIKTQIHRLIICNLQRPLEVFIERDEDEFIARSPDLDCYGSGESPIVSIRNLRYEIEDLYFDLLEDDYLSREWKNVKKYLLELVEYE
jgi:hypothetical protein